MPNFLIIGAQRSGTSSLNHYLRQHPQVFMAPGKELRFFNRNFERGLGWYEAHFEDSCGARAVGEATPSYMYEGVAVLRMAEVLPFVRLVAILRNPVARAYSHYQMIVARGRETRTFEEAVEEELSQASGASSYLDQGRYLSQLERLGEQMPNAPLHVMITERFISQPREGFETLCRFLDVDHSFVPLDIGKAVNRYVEFRSLRLRRIAHSFGQGLVRRGLDALNTKQVDYVPMRLDVQRRLEDVYAEEVRGLRRYLGVDLSQWW